MAIKKKGFTQEDLEAKGFVKNEQGFYSKPSYPIKPDVETGHVKKVRKVAQPLKHEVPGSNYRGKRKSKYNVSTSEERTYNGNVYMSKLEMRYRQHLDDMTMAIVPKEKVVSIKEQVPFVININDKKICTYFLDFEVHYADGRTEYVDCKGMKTSLYSLKKKLVEAYYPIKIKEINKGDF